MYKIINMYDRMIIILVCLHNVCRMYLSSNYLSILRTLLLYLVNSQVSVLFTTIYDC